MVTNRVHRGSRKNIFQKLHMRPEVFHVNDDYYPFCYYYKYYEYYSLGRAAPVSHRCWLFLARAGVQHVRPHLHLLKSTVGFSVNKDMGSVAAWYMMRAGVTLQNAIKERRLQGSSVNTFAFVQGSSRYVTMFPQPLFFSRCASPPRLHAGTSQSSVASCILHRCNPGRQ